MCFFVFKQKTAYEMRISDWSSDVCSSDLQPAQPANAADFRDDRLAILDRVADEAKSMDRDAAAFQRFDRQQAVVDRAESGAGADAHRNLPACEKIGIKKGSGARYEHAARAVDQDVAGEWGHSLCCDGYAFRLGRTKP